MGESAEAEANTKLFWSLIYFLCNSDRKSYLPEQRVRLYMYQLCKSIYHMHRNGIFHRDVKPENILIKVKTATTTATMFHIISCIFFVG